MTIPFHKPHITETDIGYIKEALYETQLVGNGPFTKRCHDFLEKNIGSLRAFLTTSCTSALEMSALLLDIQPGDEVIVPSFTFVSTVNAFVLRGGVPVFVDVREDTLNLDERLIESAITEKTKCIVPVHYAGVSCEMDTINDLAKKHNLAVVEDAAQGVGAFYKGKALGTLGTLGAYSFHGTKHVVAGEAGALLVNDNQYIERAEIIREKGTDRSKFLRGAVDKYTWQDVGSSFLPSELTAAFLLSQLEHLHDIIEKRRYLWDDYHKALLPLEQKGVITRQKVPDECFHNAHMYYVLLNLDQDQEKIIKKLTKEGIQAFAHYAPLHDSPGGRKFARVHGSMNRTESVANRIIRLPLWIGMQDEHIEKIVKELEKALR